VVGIEPTIEQQVILEQTFGLLSASAFAQMHDRKAAVTTENVIQTVIMGSQIDRFDVVFQGGPVPVYKIDSNKPDEDGLVEDLGKVLVVSGAASYNTEVCDTLKELGAKTVVPAHSTAVNLGVIVGTAFRFSVDKSVSLHPFIPQRSKIPGVSLQRLDTGLAGLILSDFTHSPAAVATIVADVAKKSAVMLELLNEFPLGKLGIRAEDVQRQPLFSGREFRDLPVKTLSQYWYEGYMALGKARDLIKNSDTGYAAMNAPMKWKIALEAALGAEGSLQQRWAQISYFGAAGGRARRMFERRGDVTAYDLKPSPVPSSKVPEEDFVKYKIDRWTVIDIFQMAVIPGEVFVSDIYIDNWREVGPDLGGHKFVSGVLQGFIANNDLVTCKQLPPIRMVKGFLPDEDDYVHYANSYPFFALRVCRPITTEIIYLSVSGYNVPDYPDFIIDGDGANYEQIPMSDVVKFNLNVMDNMYEDFPSRWLFVKNRQDHEKFVRGTYVTLCEELNFQQRKTCLDPRIKMTSPHNRNWGLAKEDLPCLYVPKHMRACAVNCIDSNSASFGALAEGEIWNDDDVVALQASMAPEGQNDDEVNADDDIPKAEDILKRRVRNRAGLKIELGDD
jgi:hypothetical protein